MGINQSLSNLSGALFSRVQSRVLAIFFGEPDREFQLSEIIAKADSGRGAVQREVEKLTSVDIISIVAIGSRKLYRANRKSPIFKELQQLILKTIGIVDPLRDALTEHRNSIASAFVYGSLAKGKDTAKSDIDVMIIGDDLAYSEVYSALQNAERILARPVNPNIMAKADWIKKLKDENSFARKISKQSKLFIFGTENELRSIGQSS